MKAKSRTEQYRRRRYRVARHRRGVLHNRIPLISPHAATATPTCTFPGEDQLAFHDAMGHLARKVCCHESVTGLLYRCRDCTIEVHVVASRPMTAPVALLADTWKAELNRRHPEYFWTVHVSHSPPATAEQYHCVYWRAY